jgi:hypothetical protein
LASLMTFLVLLTGCNENPWKDSTEQDTVVVLKKDVVSNPASCQNRLLSFGCSIYNNSELGCKLDSSCSWLPAYQQFFATFNNGQKINALKLELQYDAFTAINEGQSVAVTYREAADAKNSACQLISLKSTANADLLFNQVSCTRILAN